MAEMSNRCDGVNPSPTSTTPSLVSSQKSSFDSSTANTPVNSTQIHPLSNVKGEEQEKLWRKHRGTRELHNITVETYKLNDETSKANKLLNRQTSLKSSKSSKESTPELALDMKNETSANRGSISSDRKLQSGPSLNQIQFYSGNHFVEVTKGILHLYKENKLTPLGEEAERSELVCILSVPASMTIHDLLQFTAPVNQDIQHIRIIRDNKPNQYMVLIKFCNQRSADEFYSTYNGIRFNSIEQDICHLVFVAQVETVKESENACLPLHGYTELPTCPVCLERMDESVEGILTILCNHSFHGNCLDKWGDSSCPVCRYCQTPELLPDNRCFECGSQASQQDSLWICLICGHIGCGRYVEGHAYKHYCETQHTYAMQLGLNNRVWDYAGDNYVHRLLQNKDGKPVEVECNNQNDEKIDSVQLEYTYLLTNQLESQRNYFEETISRIEKDASHEIEEILEKNKTIIVEKEELEGKLNSILKEKQIQDKKMNQLTTKLTKLTAELQEESEMNKCLRENQQAWQQRLSETELQLKQIQESKTKEIQDLKEQIRDLMFFLETQEKLKSVSDETREEIASGQIVVQQNENSVSKSKSKNRKR